LTTELRAFRNAIGVYAANQPIGLVLGTSKRGEKLGDAAEALPDAFATLFPVPDFGSLTRDLRCGIV
jgi:hypothetical protein